MLVETTKNQIILNQIIGQKKERRLVETDLIVNDVKPDVLSVISTNGVVSVYKKEIMDGKVRIDGTINTFVIYIADDENGSARSLNTSLDFTQIIDIENCTENMQIQENIIIKNFDTRIINGRKINIKANLETNIKIYSNESFDIITGIENEENIRFLKNTQKITSLVGIGKNKIIAKDTISIDIADELAEIMKVNIKIMGEETKISYNKVLSKADAEVEIMYLTEDNRINTVITTIPIMGFVDIQNVNENCRCEIQNSLSNLIIKPNNTEAHSIYVEAEIDVNCTVYETNEMSIIEDLYSITEDIEFTKKEINVITERNTIIETYILKENIRIPEITGRVLDIQNNPEINNMQIRNDKIIYEGNLGLNIMFEQNNNVDMRVVDLPFNFDIISDKIKENSQIDTILKIKQNDFIIKDGTIEVTIGIQFIVSECKNKILNIINEIEISQSKECESYSMVIYFVKPGDTIWKIAKMFKSTIEDIAKINSIEDVNIINVGQQLYIPRFCRNRITVQNNG